MNDYSNLFYYNPFPHWVYDIATFEILDVNQAAIDLYGHSRQAFLSLLINDLTAEEEVPNLLEFHKHLKQKKGNIHFGRFTHKKKCGALIRVDINGHKVEFQGKEAIMVVCQDITLKEQHFLELQQSRKNLETASEIARLGYWKYDITANAISCSDKVYEIWGKQKEEAAVRYDSFLSSIHPDDLELFNLEQESALSGQAEMDFVHRILLPDGSVRWVREQGRLNKTTSGEHISFEGTVQDITDQKKEEQRLKLLESVITHTNDAVMITEAEPFDEPGPRILYVNRAFTRMTGYSSDDVIGKSPRILQGPKSDKEELKKLSTALRNWKSCEITTINYKKNGTPFWINFSVSPVADEKGWFTHWISIERDVTAKSNEQVQKDLFSKLSAPFKEEEKLSNSLQQVCKLITTYGDFSFCEVWLPTIHNNSLRLTAKQGKEAAGELFYENSIELKELGLGEGLPGEVWKGKQPVLWGNIDKNNLFIRKEAAQCAGLKSAMGLPLKHRGSIVGVLMVGTLQNEKLIKTHYPVLSKFEEYLGSEIYRKRLEEDLKYLFETLPDMICLMDFTGRFLKINQVGCDLLGYPEAEIVGSSFQKFVHTENKDISEDLIQKVKAGQKVFQLENRYLTKSGTMIWLSWHFNVVLDERVVYATAKNITEAKKLQEVVADASHLAKIGGWEIDMSKKELIWSKGVHQIYETCSDTFQPTLDEAIDFYREDYKELVKNAINRTLENGEPFDYEAAFISAKGNEKWVRAIGQVEMVNGKCIRLYGSFQDISKLKEVEHRLQAISNDLPGVTFQHYIYPNGTHKLTSVSKMAHEIWGLSPEQCEADPQKIWNQIVQAGDADRIIHDIQKAVETLSQWHSQWKYILPNGKIRWHEGFGTPHQLNDGTILFNSMVFDITEEIKLSNLHEETSELAKIGSWEQDMITASDTQTMYWSPMIRKILEVSPNYEATLARSFEFYSDEGRPIVEKCIAELIENGTEYDKEVALTTYSGKEKWVRIIGKSERVNRRCTKIFGSIQDIHSMKSTQLQLKEILGSISDAFYALDRQWNFTYFNREAEHMLGKKSEQVLGKNFWQQFAPVLGTTLETVYKRVALNGIAETFEYHYPGDGCWYEINAYPSNDGISAYFKNIDEKKNAAEALQRAFEEKKRILESIGDAFFTVDKDWIITYWNRQAECLLGRERSTIIGKQLWEEYPDAVELQFYTKYHEARATGQTVSFEEFYPTLGKWFEVTGYPSAEGLSVYFKDVTLRKEADIQILQANERFEKVAQATTDAIWDWDLKNKIFHRSSGFEKLFGYKAEKSVQEAALWEDSYHPDDLQKIQASINKSLLDPAQEFWQKKYRIVHSQGEIKTVIDKGVIIRNECGQAIRMVGAITDISEHIKHEKALHELNIVLKKNIKDLQTTNDQLEQFAFIASHDLQEPLRMITSFLNQLQRRYSGQLDEKADQYIYYATDGAKRMKQIILDLLDYSRAGKELEHPERIDLNKIIVEYTVLRSRLIREKAVKIIADDFPKLACFKVPLTQIIHCLLDNAIKYSKAEEPPVIRISVSEKKEHWEVKVADNGIGIDSRFFDKVFIIFQRLHDRDTYGGNGMGLSISKKHVESMGGKIWLESELGIGSTFYFTIKKTGI